MQDSHLPAAARRIVFATAEGAIAEEAFGRAEQLLWEKVAQIPGAEVRSIEHSIATRTVSEKSLNLEKWTTELVGELSTVIVSLLASVTVQQGPVSVSSLRPGEANYSPNNDTR